MLGETMAGVVTGESLMASQFKALQERLYTQMGASQWTREEPYWPGSVSSIRHVTSRPATHRKLVAQHASSWWLTAFGICRRADSRANSVTTIAPVQKAYPAAPKITER